MLAVALALLTAGLLLLAFAQDSERRRGRWWPLGRRAARLRRALGAALLGAALAPAWIGLGAGFGILFWGLASGLAGVLVSAGLGLTVARRVPPPRWERHQRRSHQSRSGRGESRMSATG